jgi:hypothetical protein
MPRILENITIKTIITTTSNDTTASSILLNYNTRKTMYRVDACMTDMVVLGNILPRIPNVNDVSIMDTFRN